MYLLEAIILMIANLMASSVSIISATEKKAKAVGASSQQFGAAEPKQAAKETGASRAETISLHQDDTTTSDGQGRESAHVLASHSPDEQLSSPKMPLSPLTSHGKRHAAIPDIYGRSGAAAEQSRA